MRIRHFAAATIAGFAITGVAASPVFAAVGATTPVVTQPVSADVQFEGMLSAVDVKAGTVTVQRMNATGTTESVTAAVPATAPVTLDGAVSKLAALPAKIWVKVSGTMVNNVRTVKRLDATTKQPQPDIGLQFDGVLTAVDTKAGTATLSRPTPTGAPETIVVTVPATAAVLLDGAPSTLAKLPLGTQAKVSGTTVNNVKTVNRLEAFTKTAPQTGEMFDGTLTAVDTKANTITVQRTNAAGTTENVVVPVPAAAPVTLDGAVSKLAALPAKTWVKVSSTMVNNVRTVNRVDGFSKAPQPDSGLQFSGVLTAVDTKAGTATLSRPTPTGTPETIVVAVPATAVVLLDGVPSTLAKLPLGAQVNVAANNVKTASRLEAFTKTAPQTGEMFDGTLTAVDTKANTITVQRTNAAGTTENVVVPVPAAAPVTLDGAVSKLAALPAKIWVKVSSTMVNNVRTVNRVDAFSKAQQPDQGLQLDGVLTAIDTKAGTATLSRPTANGAAETITVAVPATAAVLLDGAPSTLAKLPLGAKVNVAGTTVNNVKTVNRLEAFTKTAQDNSMQYEGTLAKYDTATNTITVTRPAANGTTESMIIVVPSNVVVTLDGAPTKLSAVPAKTWVRLSATMVNNVKTLAKIEALSKH